MVESQRPDIRPDGRQDRAHLMVRNAERALIYWSVTHRGRWAAAEEFEADVSGTLIGRLAVLDDDGRVDSHVELELGTDRGHRFVEFGGSGRRHRFWVGLRQPEGGFVEIAASPVVESPRGQPGEGDIEFVDFDVEALEERSRRVDRPVSHPSFERGDQAVQPSSHAPYDRPSSGEH